jgi:hypothetical protein
MPKMHGPSLRVIIYLNVPTVDIPSESFRPGPSYSNSLIGEALALAGRASNRDKHKQCYLSDVSQ